LKGRRTGQGRWVACCPAHADRTPSLSIGEGTKVPILLHCHAGCDPRDVLAELRARGLLDDGRDGNSTSGTNSPKRSRGSDSPPSSKPVDTERLQRDLDQGKPVHECPLARRYYAARGIDIVQLPWLTPLVFRESFRNWITNSYHPAILAPVVGIRSNKLQALQITFLRPDASAKADIHPPRLYSGPKKGGCVKLWPDEEVVQGLAIAEGIETALSAIVSSWPTWACLDAGNLGEFPVLNGIDALTIFADHDESGTGQNAARRTYDRWRAAGKDAAIILPSNIGADWNDAVCAGFTR
jgi:hypothetical protein